jgi:TPR repeat protein
MMRVLLVSLTLLAMSMASASEIDDAIEAAETLRSEGRFAEALEKLRPYEAKPTGDVAFSLAWIHLTAAMERRTPEAADQARLDLARQWAERAREIGNPAGANLLYMMYANGYGVPEDMRKAAAYLQEAAQKGDPAAQTNYAVMAYRGSPEIPRDRALAAKYLAQLDQEDQMLPAGYYYLGLLRYNGEGGHKKNEKAGMELIEMAAEGGHGEAQQDTGRNYEFGWTVKADIARAIEWYEKAAEQGEGWSLWRIGMTYVNGEGRDPDSLEAVKYFRRAADAGNPDGMTSLAVMYATGDGVKRDFAEARRYYELAADAGSDHALLNLAGMYLRGEGVTVDMVQAYVLASIAEQRGSEQAVPMRRGIEKELSAEQRAEADRRLAGEK